MKTTKTEWTARVFILTALVTIGSVPGSSGAAPNDPPEPGFAWKDGAEVYAKICALCHETKVGPAIRGRDLDPEYIKYTVRYGSNAMPAFRTAEIDDQFLEKVAEYVSKTAVGQ
jgi:mono/diheme cytochrome c family protein